MEQAYNHHVSVMLDEVIEYANLKKNSKVLDMTLGRAGHSSEFLKRIPEGFLYGVDQDKEAFTFSEERLSKIGTNFKTIDSNFAEVPELLKEQNIQDFDFIFFDLGVSSPQFDDPKRGFSYRFNAPLDMRMDQNVSSIPTAKYVVNKYDAETLMKALYEFADEKFAKSIVRNIIKSREQKTIETTFELVDIVKKSLPPKELHKDGHPAKKTFLAIRYLVNSEKGAINTGIPAALDLLKVGGRLGVLTFNSYEDGLVKTIFKKATTNEVVDKYLPPIDKPINYKLVTRKPISPTIEEIERNNRSKPAKLRVIERIGK